MDMWTKKAVGNAANSPTADQRRAQQQKDRITGASTSNEDVKKHINGILANNSLDDAKVKLQQGAQKYGVSDARINSAMGWNPGTYENLGEEIQQVNKAYALPGGGSTTDAREAAAAGNSEAVKDTQTRIGEGGYTMYDPNKDPRYSWSDAGKTAAQRNETRVGQQLLTDFDGPQATQYNQNGEPVFSGVQSGGLISEGMGRPSQPLPPTGSQSDGGTYIGNQAMVTDYATPSTASATAQPDQARTSQIQQHINWLQSNQNLSGDALYDRVYQDAVQYGVTANELASAMGWSLDDINAFTASKGYDALPAGQAAPGGMTPPGRIGPNSTQAEKDASAAYDYYNGNNVPNQTDGGVTGTMFLNGPGSPGAVAAQTETRQVSPEETSQYQLEQMLDTGGPLMERVAAQAKAAANSRGLLNSSMAVESAQGAMVDAAQPFAINDANTFAQAASENMSETNATNRQNAQQFNDMLYDDYSSTKERQFQGEQAQLDRENQLTMQEADNQFKVTLQEMSDAAAMLRQKSAENAKLTETEKTQLAGMFATYTSSRSEIMSADLKLEHKNQMIRKMDEQFLNDIAAYSDLTGIQVSEDFYNNMNSAINPSVNLAAGGLISGGMSYVPGTRNQAVTG